MKLTRPQKINDPVSMIQPHGITGRQIAFNQRQMNIFILILDRLRAHIDELFNPRIEGKQANVFQKPKNFISVKIPIRDFHVSPKRYGELKQDLAEMAVIPVRFQQKDRETGKEMEITEGLYTLRIPGKWARFVEILIQRDVARHILNLNDGYTRYNKQVALNLKGVHAKRLYMFISSWQNKGTIAITMEQFREMMQLGDKYKQFRDLMRWVIHPCYQQLKEQSDCWFEVDPQYQAGERQPSQLVFKIFHVA